MRFLYYVERNFRVWRKLLAASLVANLADPLIYLVGLGFGIGTLVGDVDGKPYVTFLAGGMICYSTLNSATAEALYSGFSRLKMQRTWEAVLHAPMTVADVVLGEWVWAAIKALLSGCAILLILYVLGIVHGVRPIAVLPLLFLLGLSVGGVALVMTTLARNYDFFTYYFTLVLTPMGFLSGVFFPLHNLPLWLQRVAWCLPLAHATGLSRQILFGGPIEGLPAGCAILAAYGMAGVAIAIHLAQRRLTR
jgi:lipooligosaccharide transport system permease protein